MADWTRIIAGRSDTSTQFNYYTDGTNFVQVAEGDSTTQNTGAERPEGAQALGVGSRIELDRLVQVQHAREQAGAPEPVVDANGTQRAAPTLEEQNLFERLSRAFGGNAQAQAKAFAYIDNPPAGHNREAWIHNELGLMTRTPAPTPESLGARLQQNLKANIREHFINDFGMTREQANIMTDAIPLDQLPNRAQQLRVFQEVRQQLIRTGMPAEQFQQFARDTNLVNAGGLPRSTPVQMQAAARAYTQHQERLTTLRATIANRLPANSNSTTLSSTQFMQALPENLSDQQRWVADFNQYLTENPQATPEDLSNKACELLQSRDVGGSGHDEVTVGNFSSRLDQVQTSERQNIRSVIERELTERLTHSPYNFTNAQQIISFLPHPYGSNAGTTQPLALASVTDLQETFRFLDSHPTRESLMRDLLPQTRGALAQRIAANVANSETPNEEAIERAQQWIGANEASWFEVRQNTNNIEPRFNSILQRADFLRQENTSSEAQTFRSLIQREVPDVRLNPTSAPRENAATTSAAPVQNAAALSRSRSILNSSYSVDNLFQEMFSDILADAPESEINAVMTGTPQTIAGIQHRLLQHWEERLTTEVRRQVNGEVTVDGPHISTADAHEVARHIIAGRLGVATLPNETGPILYRSYDSPDSRESRTSQTSDFLGSLSEAPNLGMNAAYRESTIFGDTQVEARRNFVTQAAAVIAQNHPTGVNGASPRSIAVTYLRHLELQSGEHHLFQRPGALQNLATQLETSSGDARTNLDAFVRANVSVSPRPYFEGLNAQVTTSGNEAYSNLLAVPAEGTAAPVEAAPSPSSRTISGPHNHRENVAGFHYHGSYSNPRGGMTDVYINGRGNGFVVGEPGARVPATGTGLITALPAAAQTIANGPAGVGARVSTRNATSATPSTTPTDPTASDTASLVNRSIITREQADNYTILHQEVAAPAASATPAAGTHARGTATRTARPATPATPATAAVDEGAEILRALSAEGTNQGPVHRRFETYLQRQTALRFLQTHQSANISPQLTLQRGVAMGILRPSPLPSEGWPVWPSGTNSRDTLTNWANTLANPGMRVEDQTAFTQQLRQDQAAAGAAQAAQQAATAGAPRASEPRTVSAYTLTATQNVSTAGALHVRIGTAAPQQIPAPPSLENYTFAGRTIENVGGHVKTTYFYNRTTPPGGTPAHQQRVFENGRMGNVTEVASVPAFNGSLGTAANYTFPANTPSSSSTTNTTTTTPRLTTDSVRLDTARRQVINEFLSRHPDQPRNPQNPRNIANQILRAQNFVDQYGNPTSAHSPAELRQALAQPLSQDTLSNIRSRIERALTAANVSTTPSSSSTPGAATNNGTAPNLEGAMAEYGRAMQSGNEADSARAYQSISALLTQEMGSNDASPTGSTTDPRIAALERELNQILETARTPGTDTTTGTNSTTRALIEAQVTQATVQTTHQQLMRRGLSEPEARAVELDQGLISNLNGEVARGLTPERARAALDRLSSSDTPLEDLRRSTQESLQHKLQDRLRALNFTPNQIRDFMINRQEFGAVDQINLANLGQDYNQALQSQDSTVQREILSRNIQEQGARAVIPSADDAHTQIEDMQQRFSSGAEGDATSPSTVAGAATNTGGRNRRGGAAAGGDGGGSGMSAAAARAMDARSNQTRANAERDNSRESHRSNVARETNDRARLGVERATLAENTRSHRADERTRRVDSLNSMMRNLEEHRHNIQSEKLQMLQAMMQLLGQLITSAIGALAQVQAANIGAVAQINAGLTQSRGRTA